MDNTPTVSVWDRFVRVFHWTLVTAFFVAYLTEDDVMGLHVWAGYLVFSLVVLRIGWGFVGTTHARFASFVRRPAEVVNYLKRLLARRAPRYVGHNPAGGAMIVALLISLIATTSTGMVLYGAAAGSGPLAGAAAAMGVVGEHSAEAFEEVHEFFANFTLLLVAVHVTGVILESLRHGENLVRAMVTGRKRV